MEQAKKRLKTASLIVLLFAGLTLLGIITELAYGDLNSAQIPAGSPENILLITKMILLGVTAVLLLPKVYVGIKGLKMAKAPTASKTHIIVSVIIFVILLLELIEPILGIVNGGGFKENFSSLAGLLLELVIYYDYIKAANAVAKLAN